ncbi:MAG: hypothetical protein AABY18_02800 [Candidatus Thermoplasmatota archaeon]
MPQDARKPRLSHFLTNLSGQVLPYGLAFIATPFIYRWRTPSEAALWALWVSTFLLLVILETAAVRTTVQRLASRIAPGTLQAILLQHIRLGTAVSIGGLGLVLIAAWTIPLLQTTDAILSFASFAPLSLLMLANGVFRGALDAEHRFQASQGAAAFASGGVIVVGLAAAYFGFPVSAVAASAILLRTTSLLALWAMVGKPALVFGASMSGIRRQTSWMILAALLGAGLLYFDRFALAAFAGPTRVASYAAMIDLVAGSQIAASAAIATLFPTFAAAHASNDRTLLAKSILGLHVLLAAPLLLLAFLPRFACGLYAGPVCDADAEEVLRILSLGALLSSGAPAASAWLQAKGRPDMLPKYYLVTAVPFSLAVILAASKGGPVALAVVAAVRALIDTLVIYRMAVGRNFQRSTNA